MSRSRTTTDERGDLPPNLHPGEISSEPLEECGIGGIAEGDDANRQAPGGLYSLSVTRRQLSPPCRSGAVRELEA